MTPAQLIGLAIQLSMATIIFCVALRAHFGDVVFLWPPGVMTTVLLALIVGSLVTAPYVKWRQRRDAAGLPQGSSQTS